MQSTNKLETVRAVLPRALAQAVQRVRRVYEAHRPVYLEKREPHRHHRQHPDANHRVRRRREEMQRLVEVDSNLVEDGVVLLIELEGHRLSEHE